MGTAFFLPFLIERVILPDIVEKWGAEQLISDVRRAGASGLDIGGIRIAGGSETGVSVPSLQADYSIFGLLQKKVQRVTIAGIVIRLDLSDGGAAVDGLDLAAFTASRDQAPEKAGGFSVETLEIKNGILIVRQGESRFALPADIAVNSSDGKTRAKISIPGTDHSLLIETGEEPDAPKTRASLNIKGLDLKSSPVLGRIIPELAGSGVVDINGEARFSTAPFGITSGEISCSGRSWAIERAGVRIASMNSGSRPMTFKYVKNGASWTASLCNVRLNAPFRLDIPEFEIKGEAEKDRHTFSGLLSASTPYLDATGQNDPRAGSLKPLSGSFSGNLSANGKWGIHMKCGPGGETGDISGSGGRKGGLAADISVSGTAFPGSATFQFDLSGRHISLHTGDASYTIDDIKASGRREPETSGNEKERPIHFTAESSGLHIVAPSDIKFTAPAFSVKGGMYTGHSGGLSAEAVLNLSDASVNRLPGGLAFSGISGTIPFAWPFQDSAGKGTLEASQFRWKNYKFGPVTASIAQSECGLIYEARNDNRLAPGTSIHVSGGLDLFHCAPSRLDYRMDRPAQAPPVDLGEFFPDSKGVLADGTLHLEGTFAFGAEDRDWPLKLSLEDGEISTPHEKANIDGIRASLEIPDMRCLRSRPKQPFAFRRASFGNIKLEKGDFAFQIEPGASVFVEKCRFLWCNGIVDGQAFRFAPGENDYNLVFHCDGVQLAQLLKQLDIGKAGGDGTVNGKIPIQFKNGDIIFDNGFLYSTPGVGGVIRVEGADDLAAGVSQTRRLGQIDLVLEALKEYTYKWVKLNLNTVEEDLMMRLQFDGKPSRPLPFSYEPETGGFVRIQEGRSVFQGISLDVNFRIPLNELLKYKDILKLLP